MLFILALNPLSYLIKQLKGYPAGQNRNINVTHNFFVDDLKLYNSSLNGMKKQLDLVTSFSRDIGMKFGEDKCAFIKIEKGNINSDETNIKMNNLTIKQIQEGESYKYLGQDENISYVGKVNKENVIKEYLTRTKKIWKSNLSAFNKSIAHNMFAVPVLTPTFGILDWTLQEIKQLDIKTRKLLSMCGSFHVNSDVDCLYIPRSEGGRGLRSIQVSYESRIISLSHHLTKNIDRNYIINFINTSEENYCLRVSRELQNSNNINVIQSDTPRAGGQKYIKAKIKEKSDLYRNKVMHGYFARSIENDPKIDHKNSKSWTRNRYMTSHFEAYAFAIKDQELPTKYLKSIRNKESNVVDSKCRLCKNANEDIIHIISHCPKMSVRYYLPVRHDVIAKTVYNALIKKQNINHNRGNFDTPEYIHKEGNTEYWWNVSVETATRLQHNKPDIVVWDHDRKTCKVIEVSCPADCNVSRKVDEKIEIYGPLIRNLQIMYNRYRFQMLTIIVGALGTIPYSTVQSLKDMDFSIKEVNKLTRKLQQFSIQGTIKICKTFLKFSE